jgi:hypothetical protein
MFKYEGDRKDSFQTTEDITYEILFGNVRTETVEIYVYPDNDVVFVQSDGNIAAPQIRSVPVSDDIAFIFGRVNNFVESLDEIKYVETDGETYRSVDEFCDRDYDATLAVLSFVGEKNGVRFGCEMNAKITVRRDDPVENILSEIAELCE